MKKYLIFLGLLVFLFGCLQAEQVVDVPVDFPDPSEFTIPSKEVVYYENLGPSQLDNWYCSGTVKESEENARVLLSNFELFKLLSSTEFSDVPSEDQLLLFAASWDVGYTIYKYKEGSYSELFGLYPASEFLTQDTFPDTNKVTTLYGCFERSQLDEIVSGVSELYSSLEETAEKYPSLDDIPEDVVFEPETEKFERLVKLELTAYNLNLVRRFSEGKDFGDAYELFDEDNCGYPSSLSKNGARHLDVSKAILGDYVSVEDDAKLIDRDEYDDGLIERNRVKVQNLDYDGSLYLNILIDLNKTDGCRVWSKEYDWIVRNVKFDLDKGETDYYYLPFSLPEETWIRITLTGEPLVDYEGMGEFDIGETEDYYFVSDQVVGADDEDPIIPPDEPPDLEPDPDPDPPKPPPFPPIPGIDFPPFPGDDQGEPETIPATPKKIDQPRFLTGKCPANCGYNIRSDVWRNCAEKACGSCLEQSSYCDKYYDAKKFYNDNVVKKSSELNQLYDSYANAKTAQDKQRFATEWRAKYKDYLNAKKEADEKWKEMDEQYKKDVKDCRKKAAQDCKDVEEEPVPGDTEVKCTPVSYTKYISDNSKIKEYLDDLQKDNLEKWNEIRRNGGGAMKFFFWYVMKQLTPESLRERAKRGDGATLTEIKIPVYKGVKFIYRNSYLKPIPQNDSDCCPWVRVSSSHQQPYEYYILADKIDFDFKVTFADFERFSLFMTLTPLSGLGDGIGNFVKAMKLLNLAKAGFGIYEAVDMVEAYNAFSKSFDLAVLTAENLGLGNVAKALNKFKPSIEVLAGGAGTVAQAYVGQYEVNPKGSVVVPKAVCYVPGEVYVEYYYDEIGRYPCSSYPSEVSAFEVQGIKEYCPEEKDLSEPKEDKPKEDKPDASTGGGQGGDVVTGGNTVPDKDKDGIPDDKDNCPNTYNPNQRDQDGDGLGDVCDNCPKGDDSDKDGLCDVEDNCPELYNPNQEDTDEDGIGDYCDSSPFGDGASYCSDYSSAVGWSGAVGGPTVLAQGSITQAGCADLLTSFGEAQDCTTLCRFVYYKQWTWTINGQIVNRFACCWGYSQNLPCTDCPGQNPQCPSGEACAAVNPFPSN